MDVNGVKVFYKSEKWVWFLFLFIFLGVRRYCGEFLVGSYCVIW